VWQSGTEEPCIVGNLQCSCDFMISPINKVSCPPWNSTGRRVACFPGALAVVFSICDSFRQQTTDPLSDRCQACDGTLLCLEFKLRTGKRYSLPTELELATSHADRGNFQLNRGAVIVTRWEATCFVQSQIRDHYSFILFPLVTLYGKSKLTRMSFLFVGQ
jgi:hypothetical protein